jgi:hypothetical protein
MPATKCHILRISKTNGANLQLINMRIIIESDKEMIINHELMIMPGFKWAKLYNVSGKHDDGEWS